MSHKNQVCGLIYFSLQVTGWLANPSLTTSGQGEARDHQCSFYNTYTFENIIRIGFKYHKNQKTSYTEPNTGVNPDMSTMR